MNQKSHEEDSSGVFLPSELGCSGPVLEGHIQQRHPIRTSRDCYPQLSLANICAKTSTNGRGWKLFLSDVTVFAFEETQPGEQNGSAVKLRRGPI